MSREFTYEKDVVLVNVHDVFSCAHCGSVTVTGVIVATIEFVHNQGCSITAQVLDLCKLRILHTGL